MHRSTWLGGVVIALASAVNAHAGIMGFGDFSGFGINQADAGSAPTIPSAGAIELTNGGGENRSLFDKTPQTITSFSASFTYRVTGVNNFAGNSGATFVIENDSRGYAATDTDNGTAFGFRGIQPSVGVVFDLFYNTTGEFTNGNTGSGEQSVSPINLESGDPINVQLTYAGSTLSERLTDTQTLATSSQTYLVLTPFSTTVGGNSAYVGISAGTSGDGGDQYFSNFQFSSVSVPEPSLMAAAAVTGLVGLARRRRRV